MSILHNTDFIYAILRSILVVLHKKAGVVMPEGRTSEVSLCYNPGKSIYQFHKCVTANGATCFVENDIDAATISMSTPRRSIIKANIRKVINLAKKGELMQAQDPRFDSLAKPCATQPDIWELRWNMNGDLYRLYYSEDGTRNPEFVALSFKKKNTKGVDSDTIRSNQNSMIADAQNRFDAYKEMRWGHVNQNCGYCV